MLGSRASFGRDATSLNDNAPALEQPATPSEAMPANPGDPTANADKASQVPPEVMAPAPGAEPLPQSSEIEKSPTPDASTAEAPKSLSPDQSASAAPEGSPFLVKQNASDLLAANLIGQSVMDANNQSIGEVTDLITDKDGKILALLIGAGGFLGHRREGPRHPLRGRQGLARRE